VIGLFALTTTTDGCAIDTRQRCFSRSHRGSMEPGADVRTTQSRRDPFDRNRVQDAARASTIEVRSRPDE
jgi:hypothetical protein